VGWRKKVLLALIGIATLIMGVSLGMWLADDNWGWLGLGLTGCLLLYIALPTSGVSRTRNWLH
jgi:hypothetical protein